MIYYNRTLTSLTICNLQKSREELSAKIEEIKQEIIGSSED